MRVLALSLLLGAVLCQAADAQTVSGRVSDAETGRGLPAATVQVEGTSRGTVSNREGDYQLAVPDSVSRPILVVRFLGYETARLAVPESGRLDVALVPAAAAIGEVVVTAEDPAERVMRRVIARKALWRAGLRTWRAEVYTRTTFRADGEVVALTEAQTDAVWDRERGLRETVTATRRTGNLGALPLDAFTAADETLNLYDDEVPFGGFDLMGPTAPRALSFYRFETVGRRSSDGGLVYDIAFRPRNPLQPGLEGTLSVLADAEAVLAVSARPSGAVQFPLVTQFELSLEQQFASFGQSVGGEPVWLPVDFRMDGRGKPGNALLQFPDLGFAISSRLTDYTVNVALPDSLFADDAVRVDSASVAAALPDAGVVPLSEAEERALAEIDSTRSLAEAIRPTGPLARFIRVQVRDDEGGESDGGPSRLRLSASPTLGYNRVEGVRLGVEAGVTKGRAALVGEVGYQTASDEVTLVGTAGVGLGHGVNLTLTGRREVVPLAPSFYVTPFINGVAALALGEDYFDYARRQGGAARLTWTREAVGVQLEAAYDDYDPLAVESTYSLLGTLPRDNARAEIDDIARVGAAVRLGEPATGLSSGLTGRRTLTLRGEGGQGSVGGGYGRFEADLRWAAPTVLRRRLLPPTLHLRLAAGTAAGDLPLVRSFGIDGQHAGLAPFGALRARTGRLTLARQYALVAWEHDFRSVPFELFGWRGSSPRGVSFAVHGAHAWADAAPGALRVEPSVAHHEVGASVGLGYTVPVRLDVTYRLTDGPGVVVGVGLARLF